MKFTPPVAVLGENNGHFPEFWEKWKKLKKKVLLVLLLLCVGQLPNNNNREEERREGDHFLLTVSDCTLTL